MKRLIVVLLIVVGMTGCRNNGPYSGGAPPAGETEGGLPTQVAGSMRSGNFVVYSDELRSGGGTMLGPADENQSVNLEDASRPVSAASIRYYWNGDKVGGQHRIAQMTLTHTPEAAAYAGTPGLDLRAAHFGRVSFAVRGWLARDVVLKIEMADDADPATPAPCLVLSANGRQDDTTPDSPGTCARFGRLKPTWQKFTLPIGGAPVRRVKDFFKATFVYKGAGEASRGGEVFFDKIQYEP